MADNTIDLSDWLGSLRAWLARCADEFRKSDGTPIERQAAAYAALSQVGLHLHELPGLSDHLEPLLELAHALDHLQEGRRHELLEIHNGSAGAKGLVVKELARKAKVVALIEVMRESGWSEKDTIQKLTDWLADAGVVGNRRKARIAPGTVRKWRTDIESGDHPKLREEATRLCEWLRDAELQLGREWPMSKGRSEQVVARIARSS